MTTITTTRGKVTEMNIGVCGETRLREVLEFIGSMESEDKTKHLAQPALGLLKKLSSNQGTSVVLSSESVETREAAVILAQNGFISVSNPRDSFVTKSHSTVCMRYHNEWIAFNNYFHGQPAPIRRLSYASYIAAGGGS